jgi:hypothetical protein
MGWSEITPFIQLFTIPKEEHGLPLKQWQFLGNHRSSNYLELNGELAVKSSRAISRVNAELKTNVFGDSLCLHLQGQCEEWYQLLLVIPDINPDDGGRASLQNVGFNSGLTRLIAREDFIDFIAFAWNFKS